MSTQQRFTKQQEIQGNVTVRTVQGKHRKEPLLRCTGILHAISGCTRRRRRAVLRITSMTQTMGLHTQ